jgi:type I restriction-modification system DNA methylase subunit
MAVFDPACGSGGMFVQSANFTAAHSGSRNDISVYGQEMNPTTWRLAKMNLAIRGIEANLGSEWGDSFADDKHKDLRADFIITNHHWQGSHGGKSTEAGFLRLLRNKSAYHGCRIICTICLPRVRRQRSCPTGHSLRIRTTKGRFVAR